MDILHLVDRLEELFNQSRPIPLTRSVIVDEDRFLEIIDQMRISIPEEVKKGQEASFDFSSSKVSSIKVLFNEFVENIANY